MEEQDSTWLNFKQEISRLYRTWRDSSVFILLSRTPSFSEWLKFMMRKRKIELFWLNIRLLNFFMTDKLCLFLMNGSFFASVGGCIKLLNFKITRNRKKNKIKEKKSLLTREK